MSYPLRSTLGLLLVLAAPAPLSFAQETYTVTSTNSTGNGSLRRAIEQANEHENDDEDEPDVIVFDLPGDGPHTFRPSSQLPEITEAVVIDGLSQDGAACDAWPPVLQIELDGSQAGPGADGLKITGDGVTVRGLAIHSFTESGIDLEGSDGSTITCTIIGMNVAGTAARPNAGNGIELDGATNTTVGGTAESDRNLVSANGLGGIAHVNGASGNVVQGNYVGSDVTGLKPFGNHFAGVLLWSPGNLVGGTEEGARNVIVDSGAFGVEVQYEEATGNVVQGNYIGLGADGAKPLGQRGTSIEGTGHGIFVQYASGNTITGNVISSNMDDGIFIGECDDTVVQGNLIGTDATGTLPRPNDGRGVLVFEGSGHLIGGTEPGEGNLIAFNERIGVHVVDDVAATPILGNRIFSNVGLGIDLEDDGVEENDPGDGDEGSNRLQNFPVLTEAVLDGDDLFIEGTLDSRPNTTYRVEFFASEDLDPSGHGEGETFLGAAEVATDAGGDASFTASFLGAEVAEGQVVTATATDPDGNTSEFSEGIEAAPAAAPAASDDAATTEEDTPVEVDVLANDSGSGALVVSVTEEPEHGTATVGGDGAITYTPDEGFTGEDAFTYEVADGRGRTSEATVTVTVTEVNDAPSEVAITAPEDDATVVVGGAAGEAPADPATVVTISWEQAADTEGDPLSYRWELAADEDFEEILQSVDLGDETELELDYATLAAWLDEAGLSPGDALDLFHRVVASDGQEETPGGTFRITLVRGTLVAAEDDGGLPRAFALHEAYPNPFNPSAVIPFDVPRQSRVTLRVYDALGREVALLFAGSLSPGRHEVVWQAAGLPSGMYLVLLDASGRTFTRKVVLMK